MSNRPVDFPLNSQWEAIVALMSLKEGHSSIEKNTAIAKDRISRWLSGEKDEFFVSKRTSPLTGYLSRRRRLPRATVEPEILTVEQNHTQILAQDHTQIVIHGQNNTSSAQGQPKRSLEDSEDADLAEMERTERRLNEGQSSSFNVCPRHPRKRMRLLDSDKLGPDYYKTQLSRF